MAGVGQIPSSIRLLIADVDGTLVGTGRDVEKPVRDALEAARRRGVRIALCTGRPLFSTRRYIEALDIAGVHSFDSGATVLNTSTGDLLYHHGIDRTLAQAFLAEAQRAALHVEIYADGRYFVEEEREHSRVHSEVLQQTPVIARLDEVVERQPVTKMEFVVLNDSERAQARALTARFADQLDSGWAGAPGTSADFVNILAKGVSKGAGAARIAAYYGVAATHVLAIGDGQNDEPMLRFAGIGVAMGNAPESLKGLADWIAPSVEEHGLAYAIERYILDL